MKSIKLLAAVVAVTVSSLASATVPSLTDDVPSVIVKYNATSLVTANGVKELHRRLRFRGRHAHVRLFLRGRPIATHLAAFRPRFLARRKGRHRHQGADCGNSFCVERPTIHC